MMTEITLEQMYEMQKALDERIIKEKGLEGQDLLPNTVLALQVEIGELANEWRGFKHWSNKRTPTLYPLEKCDYCEEEVEYTRPTPFLADKNAAMCESCWNMTKDEIAPSNGEYLPDFKDYPHFPAKVPQKLLEEYVDCLHFFLSLARQIGVEVVDMQYTDAIYGDVTHLFTLLIHEITSSFYTGSITPFLHAWSAFMEIGERLGFTTVQIYQAYIAKNKVNHERQENGY